jgi:Kef-type K+ transport system membrane component KefB
LSGTPDTIGFAIDLSRDLTALDSASIAAFGRTVIADSLAEMVVVVTVIPLAFRAFAKVVAPHAPRSEFAFLLMVAVVCAFATRVLGVYYLVGAFLVGVAAQQFRVQSPAMSSEKMVHALEAFGSVFIPFYFVRAGTQIDPAEIDMVSLWTALILIVVFIPVRIALTTLHRRVPSRDSWREGRRVATALLPTLMFTLVVTEYSRLDTGLQGSLRKP